MTWAPGPPSAKAALMRAPMSGAGEGGGVADAGGVGGLGGECGGEEEDGEEAHGFYANAGGWWCIAVLRWG